jgi:hypothetical protein
VLIEWAYAYFTYRRGARLITSAEAGHMPEPSVAKRALPPRW